MAGSWFAPSPPSVAIEIASRRVTVVEVTRSSGGPIVSGQATEAIAPGAIAPALSGVNVLDPAGVADALRRALDRAGLRSTRRAALVVPDSIARVSLLAFQQLPARAADLDQLVRWQLRKATPFPIEEAQVSFFRAHTSEQGTMMAAVVARRDVVAEYEAIAAATGIQAGIVDLASFNVMNSVMAAGAASPGDWLVASLAPEAATLAILRGQELMFYRHRATVDEEPLPALVHQMAMYHEDRLGGSRFARVWVCGAALAPGGAERAKQEITEQLGVPVEVVDVRPAASLTDRAGVSSDLLDALAAPVGVLLRERKAA